VVDSEAALLALIARGQRNRTVASTKMNDVRPLRVKEAQPV
jgi:hypothetical protein